MKKLFVLLLPLLVISCGMLNHNASDIINDMRDARHAQYLNVGSGLLGLGRIISPTLAEASIGINSVQVLDLSKCSSSVRDKYRKRTGDDPFYHYHPSFANNIIISFHYITYLRRCQARRPNY